MLSITAKELKQKLSDKEDMLLIDVREPYEHDMFNIGGLLIPMASIAENISLIAKDKPVIMYCQKGIRSMIAIQRLNQKYNFSNLFNLSGGMDAWRQEFGYATGS